MFLIVYFNKWVKIDSRKMSVYFLSRLIDGIVVCSTGWFNHMGVLGRNILTQSIFSLFAFNFGVPLLIVPGIKNMNFFSFFIWSI